MMWSIRGGAVAPSSVPGMQLCRPPVRYRLRQTHVAALFTSSERFRKLSGMTGLSWCNEAANIHGKDLIRIRDVHAINTHIP